MVHVCCDGGDSIQQQDETSSLHYNESWNSNIAIKLSWCVRTKRLAARITYLNKIGNIEKNKWNPTGEKTTNKYTRFWVMTMMLYFCKQIMVNFKTDINENNNSQLRESDVDSDSVNAEFVS